MTHLQTYNPARVAAAYSPNRPNWPLAVWLTVVIGQSAMAKVPTTEMTVGRASHCGACYVPQYAVSESDGDIIMPEALLTEARLPAMPKRQYQVKMRVKSVEKGRLRM